MHASAALSRRSCYAINAIRQSCRPLLIGILVVASTNLAVIRACAADEDDEMQSGLIGLYTAGGKSVRRIDDRIAFDWKDRRPDPGLPDGDFRANWSGILLAREGGLHRFHANLTGAATIRVGGTVVLKARATSTEFHSGEPVALTPGDHELTIDYESSLPGQDAGNVSGRQAVLQIFWSSDTFTLEPLPADVLYCNPPAADSNWSVPGLLGRQRGLLLADALRCVACHQTSTPAAGDDLTSRLADILSAPDLDRSGDGQTRETLIQRLRDPASVTSNSRMPHFGWSSEDAGSIATYLISVAKKPYSDRTEKPRSETNAKAAKSSKVDDKPKKSAVEEGRLLLKTVGCIACHEVSGLEVAGPGQGLANHDHAGPSLTNVGARRSEAWLSRWLREPASLNGSHRMPVFDLTEDENRQLTAALVAEVTADRRDSVKENSAQDQSAVTADPAQVEKGRRLILRANCAACHRIPGIESVKASVPALAQSPRLRAKSDSNGCLRIPADNNTIGDRTANQVIPRFSISVQQRADLIAWFATLNDDSSQHAESDRGWLLLSRNGCTACHDRDLSRGLSRAAAELERSDPDLRGRSQALIPPSLTAVGDKLTDDYLTKAVAGKQAARRLPWLTVRMPGFRHSEQDAAALVRHLVVRDRIPDAADTARPEIATATHAATVSVATSDELLLGNQLTGAGGFNCVACHSAGSFEPRNVALGTRGSDLLTMGSRLRPQFFQRWMKNPIRVVAGIEMPAIKRPAAGTPFESLSEQMAVIWKAIRDPRFTAPTVVSRYEQFVTVGPGEPPRMIRDVFTIGEGKDREGVARAMAVGFNNGHNLLIDLDNLQLRQWTAGEFARQRTEGKSWFWGAAGTTVATTDAGNASSNPTMTLLRGFNADSRAGGDSITGIPPVVDESRSAELLRYKTDADSVTMWYRVHFPSDTVGGSAENSVRAAVEAAKDPHSNITAWNNPASPVESVVIRESIRSFIDETGSGWERQFELSEPGDPANAVRITFPQRIVGAAFSVAETTAVGDASPTRVMEGAAASVVLRQGSPVAWRSALSGRIPSLTSVPLPLLITTAESVASVPGFRGLRLPVDSSIMPTALTWLPDGRMAFTSLRGHVWIARDSDGDGVEDSLTLFEEGLAAPFGILADGDSIIVAHKPELLRLRDTDGDGRADLREVVASGWGYSDDYHDWTSGLIRDELGNLFVGLGSDYSQKDRSAERDRWRGTILKIDPSGMMTSVASGFRYPMSLARNAGGSLFATDNQGVQNTFNEINHIEPGRRYGVPSRHDTADQLAAQTPAVQVPHPWTRSVNSILFAPADFSGGAFADHGIGCEYDLRFLIRFTVQNVNGQLQGATYPFSLPNQQAGGSNFIGPICSAISPDGALYIGSIWDSGWQGGPNTGGIERLVPMNSVPNGIREVQATATGFRIDFQSEVDQVAAADPKSYAIQGYTRLWEGSYATPDSDLHQRAVTKAVVAGDRRSVELTVPDLKTGYVYDLSVTGRLDAAQPLWPVEAHYTLKAIPAPLSDR